MTAVTMPAVPASRRSRNGFAGFFTLLAFMLHRDRLRFPAWGIGLAVIAGYFAIAMTIVFPDPDDLGFAVVLSANPGSALLIGPGFGDFRPSRALFLSGAYGLYIIVGAALMSILTVSRHTRLEEQTGRAELIEANAVGRFAPLTAALTLTLAMNVVTAVLTGLVLTAMAYDPAGSFAFGAAIGAAGIAFAGITAGCVQLTEFSRTASGVAGGILGASFLVRGLGDISTAQRGDLGWLSWLSPIGWSQKVVPFGDNDWRPLLASLACFVVFTAVGYALQSRRDVGAGLVAARRGTARAAAWLAGPFALATRLQFASIAGWSISLFVGAFVYGGFTQSVIDGFQNAPQEVLVIIGGEQNLLTGYLGLMGLLMAYAVTVFAILSLQSLASEETSGCTEPVLATAVGRPRWLASWVAATAIGVVILQVAAGLGDAIGTATSMHSTEFFGDIILGHIVHIPAIWVVLGVAALLCAIRPRLTGLAWALFGYCFLLGFFGPIMDAPGWALKVSPFEHTGRYPADNISVAGVLVLTAIATALVALSLLVFRRRDLQTT